MGVPPLMEPPMSLTIFHGLRLECVKCSSEAMLYIASELSALAR